MALSLEFKHAIAAAAITRLIAGRRNLEGAAKWVSEQVGDSLYANHKGAAKARILLNYRKKILGATKGEIQPGKISVARFHYDQCLSWIDTADLKPEESARILIQTMLNKR